MERVSIFIEGTNLQECLKALDLPTVIDYRAFGVALAGDRVLGTIHFYSSPVPAWVYPKLAEAREQLFDRLRDLGFDVGPEEAVLVATVERVAKPGTRVTTFAG